MTAARKSTSVVLIAALVAAIISLTISVLVLTFVVSSHVSATEEGPLPPCATEDSTGCYWDADIMGNGEGDDVITMRDGVAEVMP